jgi:hypothetical protein
VNPLKFILALEAKLGNLPTMDKVLGKVAARLAQLDPQLQKTLKVFSHVQGALNLANRAFSGAQSAWGSAMKGASNHVKEFGRDALAQFTALATYNGLTALARGAVNLGTRLIDVVAHAERTDAVLTSLVGPEKARALDELANQISGGTEFDEDDLKKFAAGLLRVGFAFNKLPNAFALGADIAALTDGDPTQTLLSVGEALERLQSKGGLDSRILRGMGVSEVKFFADLGKRLGVSAEEAKKLAEGGKKSEAVFAQLAATVTALSGNTKAGMVGEERGQGLLATWERLKRVPDDLFKATRGTKATDNIAHGFAALAEQLGPDGPIGSRVVAGLASVMEKAGEFLKTVDLGKTLDDLAAFGESAKQVWNVFTTVFGAVAKVFDWVGTAIGTVAAELFLEVENIINFGTKIGDFFGGLVVTIVDYASKFFEAAKFLGIQVWEGLKAGVTGAVGKVGSAVGTLVDKVTGTTEQLLEIRSPSRVFERYGQLTAQGFAEGLEAGAFEVERTVDNTFDLPASSSQLQSTRPAAAGGRQAVAISAPITINYNGRGGPEAAQEIAAAVADILPGQLQSAWERMSVELGTS